MIRSGNVARQPNVTRFLEAVSDDRCEFAFARVPRMGEVELVWWGAGVVPGRSDHLERLDDEGADSLRIVTPAAARILGTWDRRVFPGAALVHVSSPAGLGLPENEQVLKPGQNDFAIGDLPPGTYMVSLHGAYERIGDAGAFTSRTLASQRVVVEPGDTRRVEFKK